MNDESITFATLPIGSVFRYAWPNNAERVMGTLPVFTKVGTRTAMNQSNRHCFRAMPFDAVCEVPGVSPS